MSNTEKLAEALRLLKSLGCPTQIMDALWLWSFIMSDDEIKLRNWRAWTEGQLVEGQVEVGKLLESIDK